MIHIWKFIILYFPNKIVQSPFKIDIVLVLHMNLVKQVYFELFIGFLSWKLTNLSFRFLSWCNWDILKCFQLIHPNSNQTYCIILSTNHHISNFQSMYATDIPFESISFGKYNPDTILIIHHIPWINTVGYESVKTKHGY